MIEKLEVSLINENVHNFKKGEFGVEKIEVDEDRGLIEVTYEPKEDGTKRVIIPMQNIEKCDFTVRETKIEKKEKENIL
ncbi:hypothetical protein [Methanobacterium oryzae]|uniref:hypothetical protein n=1 Tax=Methanobacterium oryzae TaxID=69540 RepID=UPI003D227ABF